jgi:hypothetical protein
MPFLENPPWSDDLIESNFEEITSASLPMPDMEQELGTGNYGAVYATEDDGIVFKVTSDPTEAEFIKRAAHLGWPEGIVKYKAIIDFEGTHEERPTFGIWREAAFKVGVPTSKGWDTSESSRDFHNFSVGLRSFQDAAKNVRYALTLSEDPSTIVEEAEDLEDWAKENLGLIYRMNMAGPNGFDPSPPQRLAISLNWCRFELGILAKKPHGSYVAEALLFYLDHNIVLADVHPQNVGLVMRGSDLIWVITDPGHAVFLDDL